MKNIELIIKLIAQKLKLSPSILCASTNMQEDLSLDYIDYNLLVYSLENYFNLTVPISKIKELQTVYDLANFFVSNGSHVQCSHSNKVSIAA